MSETFLDELRDVIRTVPDFPKEGVMFRDITPVLSRAGLLAKVTDQFVEDLEKLGWHPDLIVGPEARGFLFGPLLAERLGIGFIPVRKLGKLPGETRRVEYTLEYGSNVLEIHKDAISGGQKVVIIDDLLATGGTISACSELCYAAGADVLGALFLIELKGLNARESIAPIAAHALLEFPA
ncbi:MAG: adenine phosphoribosyltransferase [Candidatus Poseidoniales archaeon]|nr:adenine phosphoribosyltransferase [Candidatus Poseidoniales archaeon]